MGLPPTDVVDAPGRSDPAAADVRPGARRVRSAAVGAGAVRQRRRHGRPPAPRTPATPTPGTRRTSRRCPVAGTDRPHLVPRVGRHAHRHAADCSRAATRSIAERARAARAPTSGRTPAPAGCGATRRSGRGTGSSTRRARRSRTSSAPLTASTTVVGSGSVLAVGAVVDSRRRPAGHDQRGATRRQRGLRAERLAPRERAQALDGLEQHVQAAEHDARAGTRPSPRPTRPPCRPVSS